ncbi:uncharacterized protein LOC117338662 [Pecten maximus]|uniref:uncharacterized protein LOC117338662 n=1 Tax=Pecten maximus TaxID=6579 RepID=UPI00145873B8|nr:uncharacterized protein LOC117338662 [Pecten maximus]
MKFELEILFILLGSQIVMSDQICPNDLSANCECKRQSKKAFVTCLYSDPSNIAKILSTQAGQLQPSWIIHYFGIPNNNLTYLPNNYFDGFDVISLVNVSGNHFKSVPAAMKQLSKTTEIDLSSNQLDSLNITDLSRFKNLRKLDLSDNKITEVVSTYTGARIPTVREINLSSNDIASIEPKALLSFPNLRNLIMSGNRNFEAISAVQFPEHISAMRLESTGIKTIDMCKFKHLNDLESLNLDDNDLDCTCDLFTLFYWVESNRDDGLVHEVHGDDPKWDCLENGVTVNISEFGARMCNATSSLLQTDICTEIMHNININFSLPNISNIELIVESAESEEIVLEWDSPNTTILYGFIIVASLVGSEEEPFYKSAILHPDTFSHTVQGSDVKSGNFKVCVQVLLYNETTVGTEDCKTVYIFSTQIIVGILAGVVFIVPFMGILFCIIRLDRKNSRKEKYFYIQNELDVEAKKIAEVSNEKQEQSSDQKKSAALSFTASKTLPPVTAQGSSPVGSKSGNENQGFADGDKIEVKITESSKDKDPKPTTQGQQYGAISSNL